MVITNPVTSGRVEQSCRNNRRNYSFYPIVSRKPPSRDIEEDLGDWLPLYVKALGGGLCISSYVS